MDGLGRAAPDLPRDRNAETENEGRGRMMDPEVPDDFSRAYRSLQSPGSSACPEASRLVALLLQEVHGDTRASLAEHVIGCARCAKDYRVLLDTHQDAAPELRSLAAPRRMAAWRLAALAAG